MAISHSFAVTGPTWRESGVAMPADTARQGYGRRLIERSLAFTLRATTELSFDQDGVFCRIEVPLPEENAAASGEPDRKSL